MQVRLIIEGLFFPLVRYGQDMKLESPKLNRQSSVVCYLTSVSFFGFLSSAVCPLSSVFMQNKPNSPNVQINASLLITMNYENFASLTKVKNKPNTNPIKLVLECRSRGANFIARMPMRKPRSLIIKKLTISRMVANLRFEELFSGLVVSKFGAVETCFLEIEKCNLT